MHCMWKLFSQSWRQYSETCNDHLYNKIYRNVPILSALR